MSTILFPSPIFGPVHSRRLGISLGINLLPAAGKLCNFDCIYCECGRNADTRNTQALPLRHEVQAALQRQLTSMQIAGALPDVITFAGNGEPTLHPDFAAIIDDTIALRDTFAPHAKISVLSNATRANRPAVYAALCKVDNNILKLDTVDPHYIQHINRPNGGYDVRKIVQDLQAFQGKVIIQTMFMTGSYEGRDVSNVSDAYVLPWIEVLRQIAPQEVMIYTIERETPTHSLQKASRADLDRIVSLLHTAGLQASASY